MHHWSTYTRLANFGQSVEIVLYYYNEKNDMLLLTTEGIKMLPAGSSIEHLESVYLEREQAQGLMDSLWTCGLRPSEGTGSAGAMSATQEHIKDLQNVYKKLFEIVSKQ